MHDLFVCLLSMVIVVPLFKRLGLGAVVGYLIAGVLIGSSGFAILKGNHEVTSQVAEFGVTMMLFMIGLELRPELLWKMRGPILAVLPLLSAETSGAKESRFTKAGLVSGSVALIVLVGRFVIRPLFKAIAKMKLREVFTVLRNAYSEWTPPKPTAMFESP